MNSQTENNVPKYPTIGPSYGVQKDAELLFEGWIGRMNWIPRKEDPDFHVDYSVEAVNEGEPSGSLFRVQVKGRSIHKRKAKKLAERLKTKHLKYYLKCKEPVFVFLIDPAAKQGHWIFIQRYLKEKVKTNVLRNQTELAIPFEAECSLEDLALFDQDLRDAWKYMREQYPGSPIAAIRAEKKHLEQILPGHSIQILATDKSLHIQATSFQPLAAGLKPEFLKNVGADVWKAFEEKGQSFQVTATDLQGSGPSTPISALKIPADAKITVRHGNRFKGCLQFHFHVKSLPVCLHAEGEWTFAQKRISFSGRLGQSPLAVECMREEEDGKPTPVRISFGVDWSAWEGQALRGLAWFVELDEFFKASEFLVRFYVQGYQPWPPEKLSLNKPELELPIEAIGWLDKCRHVAAFLGANPPFPKTNALKEIQSDDVRLLVKFIEEGKHEQENVGQTCQIAAEIPADGNQPPKEVASMTVPEPVRELKFFGFNIPFGPLQHTWTNVELIETRPINDGRTEMTFKGVANSVYRVEFKRTNEEVTV